MRFYRILVVLVITSLISACSWFSSDDEIEPNPLVEIANPLNIRQIWNTDAGAGQGEVVLGLQLAVADQRVFAADYEGNLFALNANTGKSQWRHEYELPFSAGPGVSDSAIAMGTLDGGVFLYDRNSGTPIWQAQVSSEVLAAPIEHNGVWIVRAQDGRVFGLDHETGARIWVYDRGVPALTLRGNSKPVARAGVVYIGADDGKIIAIRSDDGTLLWEKALTDSAGRSELDRLADIDGEMQIIATDLYVSGYQGRVAGVSVSDGRLLWVRDLSSYSGLAAYRTTIAVSDEQSQIWAIDRRSGSVLWKQDELGLRQITGPQIHNGYFVVGDLEGYLHWVAVDTGYIRGREKAGNDPIMHTPVVAGDRLYAMTVDGRISAYEIQE